MFNISVETLELQCFASEAANVFYSARTVVPQQNTYPNISCMFFYRPSFKKRVASYSFLMYQYCNHAAYVAVAPTFVSMLNILCEHGYTNQIWEELTRDNYHHYIAAIDSFDLWVDGYRVVREKYADTIGNATVLAQFVPNNNFDTHPF